MKSIWLFRSNLRQNEYYHKYTNLNTFVKKAHDFYIIMLIWYLENGYYDEAVVWRLGNHEPIEFNVYGKKLIQRWVSSFEECKNYGDCELSFFRGGFQDYNKLTELHTQGLGKKLYLGAGQRIHPTSGIYDLILVEDAIDASTKTAPFYKTVNPNVFYPIKDERKKYDLCYIANFTQFKYKGQDSFFKLIAASKFLRSLKIIHLGNKPEEGLKVCKKYNIKNIEFKGWKKRNEVNLLINQSKFGLVNSNSKDGSPRVITEILSTGTPLFINSKTRCLEYYKNYGVIEFPEKAMKAYMKDAILYDYETLKEKAARNVTEKLSLDVICKKNYEIWQGNVTWR